MFEYIITIFNVVVSVLSFDKLAILACVALGIYAVWVILALVFSFQKKFSRNCKKISMLLEEFGLSSETYPKFIELGSKLPDSFLRGWNTFEHKKKGLPGDYIKRAECLDIELSGGLFNQNRSVMRTYISLATVLFGLIGFASIGTDVAITGYAFAKALIIPFLFASLAMVIYYIYTAIRQYQYRACVDDFNEMIDILNEKVESAELDVTKTVAISMQEEAAENKSYEEKQEQKVEPQEEFDYKYEFEEDAVPVEEIGDHQPVFDVTYDEFLSEAEKETQEQQETIADTAALAETQIAENNEEAIAETLGEEVMEEQVAQEPKRGRGRPRKEKSDNTEIIITNDAEFEEVLARAEKLMKKNEEALSASQQKRVEKALKELVDAMKKYKGEM